MYNKVKEIVNLLIEEKVKPVFLSEKEKEVIAIKKEKEKEIAALQKEADELLNNGMYEIFFQMIDHGYEPKKEQKNQLKKLFINSLDSLVDYDKTPIKMIELGYQPSMEELAKVFFHSSFMIYAGEYFQYDEGTFKKRTYFSNTINNWLVFATEIRNRLEKDENNNIYLLNTWKNIIENRKNSVSRTSYSTQWNIAKPYEVMRKYWPQIMSIDEFKEVINDVKQINSDEHIKTLLVQLNEDFQKCFKDKANNLIQRTKATYIEDRVDKLTMKSLEETTKNFSIRRLPKKASDIVVTIEQKCQKLKDVNDVEIQFTIENTIEKVLPETLRKYLSIDEEYRKTLTNNKGKNAEDLLMESLQNIEEKLSKLLDSKNEEKLQELEINAVYTKKLKTS